MVNGTQSKGDKTADRATAYHDVREQPPPAAACNV